MKNNENITIENFNLNLAYPNINSFIIGVSFYKDNVFVKNARFDLGKEIFIDPIPEEFSSENVLEFKNLVYDN